MEEVTILRVQVNEDGTRDAVKNIAELRENIKLYKEALNELEIGSQDYKNVLSELEVNQAALKSAMHGTATSMEQVARAAKGEDESYNGLVRTMAKYKEEIRAIDTSTAEGMEAFKNKANQIQVVNDKLKNLDALQGNYQRNVGNYKSALDGLTNGFKATAGAAGAVINPLSNMTNGLKALSTTPAIAILGLLANLLTKVAEGIKSDEEATNAWNRALAAFKPISDAFTRSLQAVGAAVAKVANEIVELLYQWGLLDEEAGRHRQAMADDNAYLAKLQRDINLENANLEETISELRAKAAERDKYTAQQRLDMLQEAAKWQMRIERNNSKMLEERLRLAKEEAALAKNDAATNDKINKLEVEVIEQRIKRNTVLRRLNREMSAAKAEIARADAKTAKTQMDTDDALTESTLQSVAEIEKALKEADRKEDERRAQRVAFEEETAQMLAEADAALTESIQSELDAQLEAEWNALEEEKRIKQQRLATFMGYTSTLADLSGAIADIYEADADADEEAAKKAKGFKIASAILSTINGAVAAFTSTWSAAELPLSVKTVLAPVNAAAVLAAGYAQVKSMNSVKVGNDSSGAAVPAPSFSPYVAQVRNVTGQREEERLYQNQRVYLVYSDLEVANTAQRVKVRETEF